MVHDQTKASDRDLPQGIPLAELADGGKVIGRVGEAARCLGATTNLSTRLPFGGSTDNGYARLRVDTLHYEWRNLFAVTLPPPIPPRSV